MLEVEKIRKILFKKTILDKDPNAEVIEITDGEELYEMSQATKVKWRALRGAVAVVSILFFLLNEGIVLMEKVKKEQQLFYRSLFWCFLYDSVGLYTEQLGPMSRFSTS